MDLLKFIDIIKIHHDGFNLSCVPFGDKYIATIRQQVQTERNIYPECYNKCFILKLDSSFNILSSQLLDENIEGARFVSWSKGIEDCRLIDNKTFLCNSLDTNPAWKSEVCYAEFEDYKITKLVPLYIDGEQYVRPEKNWLLLKNEGNIFYFLYWYNPFQVISVDISTGKGIKILSYDVPSISLNSHGGASIYLEKEKKYLVLIRNFEGRHYKNNFWLLLDKDFYLKGITDNFNFANNDNNDSPIYEFFTNLILKNNILHIFVSINDVETFVYTIELNNILNNIKPVNM
jgi:hypothetical protein